MAKPWIIGKEIMDVHGIAAVDLGQACFDGKLTACLPHSLKEVYELSKVPRIPQYPPIGVNPLEHIKTGENVEWDWLSLAESLENPAKQERLEESIQRRFSELTSALAGGRALILHEWAEIHHNVKVAMRYAYCIDDKGEMIDGIQIQDRLFFFDYDMYKRNRERAAERILGDKEVSLEYKAELSQFWFMRAAFEAWRGIDPAKKDALGGTGGVGNAEQIRSWEQAVERLHGKDKERALVAVEKWKGKSNEEAYYAIFTEKVTNATVAASKRLKHVPAIIAMFPELKLLSPPNKN
jgi:hypothetical protein